MNQHFCFVATLAAFVSAPALHAHISFSGDRNFDTLTTGVTETSASRTVSGAFGWADGTNANQGDSHRLTYYRFFLTDTTTVSISVSSITVSGQTGDSGNLIPAFSLYNTSGSSGGAVPASTHDSSTHSLNYLTGLHGTGAVGENFVDGNDNGTWDAGESFTDTNGDGEWTSAGIGGSGKEGSFNALGDWRIYNDAGLYGQFNYVGSIADGSYDLVSGITGDSVADGFVTLTFHNLVAGEYFIVVGGADFGAQLTETATHGTLGNAFPTYGVSVSVTAIPEPSAFAGLAGLGALGLAALRRRGRA